jgi:N6-adenosine-specific RNA methylase IME4
MFQTVVADPPWNTMAGPLTGREGFGDARKSKPLPYPTMTVEQIASLRIPHLADDAHLYLWTINRYLRDAFQVMEAWSFKYSTTLVWAKAPMGGGLGGCYGLATEYVLFARRGSLKAKGRIGRNWFDWKRPYDERGKPRHSAKPPEFFTMIESMSPGPYLEMFAREPRPGWSVWGNEVASDVRVSAGADLV